MFSLLTPKQAFLDAQGNPLSGGRLWTKVSGSNTNKATTKDADGLVPNTNPIILDTRGEVPFGVFGTTGPYRIILTTSGDTTDPPTSPIWTRDGVSGINDFVSTSSDEWSPTGLTPTFLTATAFSVPGDQTAIFQPRRRIRATVGGGERYATIQSSTFSTNTSVSIVPDTTGTALDGSLSAVALGKVSATNTSQPYDSNQGVDIAAAGTVTFPAKGDRFTLTGSTTIAAFANSWIGRRVYITHAAAQALTHSSNFVMPGAVGFTTVAGDETIWEQTAAASSWKLINYMKSSSILTSKAPTRQVFTASGTWTRPVGCVARLVRGVGGGGGGGATNPASGANNASAGGGGAAGTYFESFELATNATETVTIGAGGAAGTGPGGPGGVGGQTSFGGSNTAPGGNGGNGSAASTAPQLLAEGGTSGAIGGFTGTGFNKVGGRGGDSLKVSTLNQVISGEGASSHFGTGGKRVLGTGTLFNQAGASSASNNSGAGGSGGATLESGSTTNGGAGSAGKIIVDEYY